MYGTPPLAAIHATTSASGAKFPSGSTGSVSSPSARTWASSAWVGASAFSSVEGMTSSRPVEGLDGAGPVVGDREDVVPGPFVVPDEELGRQLAVRVGRVGVESAAKPRPFGLEHVHRGDPTGTQEPRNPVTVRDDLVNWGFRPIDLGVPDLIF